MDTPELTEVPAGWSVVVSYAAVAACTQLLWLTFAPITTGTARHYAVSETAAGWLANAFPLLYVALAVPAGLLLDRYLRPALIAGALLTGAGGLVRLGGDTFGWALAGQALAAIAQPLVLGAITRTVSRSLPPASRTAGIAVSSAGVFTGMVLALVLGAAYGDGRLHALLVVQAVIAAVSALALVVAVRLWARPGAAADEAAACDLETGGIRAAWADPVLRRLAALSLAGFGVFVALTTWLQALTEPAGVSGSTAGAVLAGAVAAGVVASGVLPDLVVRRRAEPSALRVAVAVAAVGCGALSIAKSIAVIAVSAVMVVACLLVALPILLDLCERRANVPAATAANLIWLAGNLGGLIVALIAGALVGHPASAFLLMAAVALGALPLLPRGVLLGSPRS